MFIADLLGSLIATVLDPFFWLAVLVWRFFSKREKWIVKDYLITFAVAIIIISYTRYFITPSMTGYRFRVISLIYSIISAGIILTIVYLFKNRKNSKVSEYKGTNEQTTAENKSSVD